MDQMKAIRQDLVIQHINNEFAIKVYEKNARMSLEVGDLNEFNQVIQMSSFLCSANPCLLFSTKRSHPSIPLNSLRIPWYMILWWFFPSLLLSYSIIPWIWIGIFVMRMSTWLTNIFDMLYLLLHLNGFINRLYQPFDLVSMLTIVVYLKQPLQEVTNSWWSIFLRCREGWWN